MDKTIKGFKVTDSNMKCRGYHFKLNYLHKHNGNIEMCESGFHYCENINDCWNYYSFDSNNRVFKIEDRGNTIKGEDKNCTDALILLEEISWQEVLVLCNIGKNNTGYRNTGYRNTGDRNTGYRNTGDSNTGDSNTGHWNTGDSNTGDSNTGDRNTGHRNTGDRNTGDRNTGHWNTTNYETGFFNTIQSEYINVFNKPCKRIDWENAIKPNFIFFDITKWDEQQNKTIFIDYKQAFQESFKNATDEDIELLKKLPNFDADVFFEISGIRIK